MVRVMVVLLILNANGSPATASSGDNDGRPSEVELYEPLLRMVNYNVFSGCAVV